MTILQKYIDRPMTTSEAWRDGEWREAKGRYVCCGSREGVEIEICQPE
jgi:hypothetical protein